jgi:hypothetical protein
MTEQQKKKIRDTIKDLCYNLDAIRIFLIAHDDLVTDNDYTALQELLTDHYLFDPHEDIRLFVAEFQRRASTAGPKR